MSVFEEFLKVGHCNEIYSHRMLSDSASAGRAYGFTLADSCETGLIF